jgi:hypothetical protein
MYLRQLATCAQPVACYTPQPQPLSPCDMQGHAACISNGTSTKLVVAVQHAKPCAATAGAGACRWYVVSLTSCSPAVPWTSRATASGMSTAGGG